MDKLYKSKHADFMQEAIKEAQAAFVLGEVPVGAVVVKDGVIIARAHNLVEKEMSASRHAEVIAIEKASQAVENWRLEGASLYVTLEPCPMCIGAMLLSRVEKVFFACHDERMGAVGSLFNLANHPELPHQIEVYSGLCAEESRMLLKSFFQERR